MLLEKLNIDLITVDTQPLWKTLHYTALTEDQNAMQTRQ